MLSAFKRLAGKSDGANSSSARPAHHSMPTTLQKKFAKGVQYNMKIIIKGDRNVGKSCLFHRLQGQKFVEDYVPTEEIQVTSIQWNYKATDDVVKVEVWDVVDRGRRRRKIDGLKMDNSVENTEYVMEEPALDAEFLDVYKGTNGVIMVMDVTKAWSFDYVQREILKVPGHIPIIVLGNHCDMSHHRTITSDHVTYFIDSLQDRTAQVRYAESSMRNGFGLKLLHKFFNLPFLQLQRQTLLKQLETNEEETNLTVQELDLYQESEDADYNMFLDKLSNRRRAVADSVSATLHVSNVPQSMNPYAGNGNGVSANGGNANAEMRRSTSMPIGPIGGGTPIPVKNLDMRSQIPKKESTTPSYLQPIAESTQRNSLQSSVQSSMQHANTSSKADVTDLPERKDPPGFRSQSLVGKIFGKQNEGNDRLQANGINSSAAPLTSVEDFVPDDGALDRAFLDDNTSQIPNINSQQQMHQQVDSESDTETANPLVAGYEDDLSSADEAPASTVQPKFAENPLCKTKHKKESFQVDKQSEKRNSISSIEQEIQISNCDYEGNEHSSLNSDAFDTWLGRDSKWRQSPEGGEDVSSTSTRKEKLELSDKSVDVSVTSSNVHLELLDNSSVRQLSSDGSSPVLKEKKKHRDKEDKEKKKKKKSKEERRDKEKSDKGEKKKKRSFHRAKDESKEQRDELEEFLNSPGTNITEGVDVAYEAI